MAYPPTVILNPDHQTYNEKQIDEVLDMIKQAWLAGPEKWDFEDDMVHL